MEFDHQPLCDATLGDVICCPEGLEIKDKSLGGDHNEVLQWRRRMIDQGLQGVIAYDDGGPRGFAEYMPAETAPLAITAPGAAVLMCYHWVVNAPDDPEHLARERDLIRQVIRSTEERFTGLVTQGWSHESHFPMKLLCDLGFHAVERQGDVTLMWRPTSAGSAEPRFSPVIYAPVDRTTDGVLEIDAAFSARCPYSLHFEQRIQETIARHPLRHAIELTLHRIDSREQALALAVPSCDWTWLFFNGEPIDLFSLPRDGWGDEISRRIRALRR